MKEGKQRNYSKYSKQKIQKIALSINYKMPTKQQEIKHLKEQMDEIVFFIKQCKHWKNMEYLNNRLQDLRQTVEDLRNRENKILPED